ncbi:MAG: beta-N-acetylhexosaminidase [Acidimicrobiales bacterium]
MSEGPSLTENRLAAARPIVPAPRQYRISEGTVILHDGFTIECPEELVPVARWFRRAIEVATGWRVEIGSAGGAEQGGRDQEGAKQGKGGQGAVRLVLHPLDPEAAPGPRSGLPGLAAESYELRVAPGAVTITGRGAAGVFYGLQTLRQLMPDALWRSAPEGSSPVPAVEIPCIAIDDVPGYAWRGVHLDVSRHFMPKSFVLKLVDLLAMHKCNVLHLHLTDDQGWRMAIEKYPRLTEVGAWRRESQGGHDQDIGDGRPHGGFYSKADLREIVAYAAERYVSVLPEVDMPGHMVAAIAAYPELGNTGEQREVMTTWGISEHVLNLGARALRFCEEVLDEVVDVFPFAYVHVGGDECPVTEWESSEAAQMLMAEAGCTEARRLQGWFTARMADHLARRGRILVGWDEILDGGAPAGSVVMSWRGEEGGVKAAAAGHEVVMAPVQWLYFDWSYIDDPAEPVAIWSATSVERVYKYDPCFSVEPAWRHRVLGAQCQLWTEYVATPEHAEYMYFPRVCAFSEVAWAGGRDVAREPYDEFEDRLADHLGRLQALGVNYRPMDGPTPGQARVWGAVAQTPLA